MSSLFSTSRSARQAAEASAPSAGSASAAPPVEPVPAAAAVHLPDWVPARDFLSQDVGLGLQMWQPAGLLVLVLAGWLVDQLARRALGLVVRGLIARRLSGSERVHWAMRPIGVVAVGLFWYWTLPLLRLHGASVEVVRGGIHVLMIFACIWFAFRMVDLLGDVVSAYASRTESKLDDVLVPLFRSGSKILAVVLGIAIGVVSLGGNLAAIVGSLAIGTVALGFAAKETVENFFGTVTVIADRPFDVGDAVVIDGKVEGVVESVGFRSTRIRTPANSLVTVPNGNLVRATVENNQWRQFRRWKTTLGVTYAATPEQLLAFTEGVRELVRQHPYTRKDLYQVYANEFGASSIDVVLVVFFTVPDGNTELRERERLLLDILRLAGRLGVSFAFPTREVVLRQGPPVGEAPAQRPPEGNADAAAQARGLAEAEALVAGQPWRTQRPPPVELLVPPAPAAESAS